MCETYMVVPVSCQACRCDTLVNKSCLLFLSFQIVIFCDFSFEDLEVMYPKIRLEEEGAEVLIVGGHPAGTKYTGK